MKGSSSSSSNPYIRTHRSDGVAELKQQLEVLQAQLGAAQSHPQLDALLEAVNALRAEVQALMAPYKTEQEQMRATLAEVRSIMATPLGHGADTQIMVDCLEQLQLLVRLHRESTDAILERLTRAGDRKRQRRLSLSEPEPGEASLPSAQPKAQ